jgi:aminoglycoside phosphotransferase family enzyme/predicted kinase
MRTDPADTTAAVAETHLATVFFTGDRAYKVKKALDLGFADFSTPQARRRACHQELELGRRFAPDVYLGVAEVTLGGEPCEWVVVMRRMPADRRLATLVRHGADVADPLRALARRLAAHHAVARRSERIDRAGGPDALHGRWVDNLDAVAAFRDTVVDGTLVDEIRDRALRYVAGRRPLLEARVAAGKIRDGHGDLLAEDIFCLDDGPRALDCLEFDDDLRSLDGLDDAACLAMDLERLGAPDLGRRFLAWYTEFSGDSRVDSLTHHYVAYRAFMRAKVAALRWAQGHAPSAADAQQLAGIAAAHLRAADPVLVLVGGGPGSGKSTIAGQLADRLGAVLLRSDRLRKEIAGLDPVQGAAQPWRTGLYAAAVTDRTYDELVSRAATLLGLGESVVLDATWSRRQHRDRAAAVAAATSSRLVQLRCHAPAEVVADRIARRAGTGDPSDATAEIAALVEAEFDAWPDAVEVPTTVPVPEAADRALRVVTDAVSAPGPFGLTARPGISGE